MEASCGGSIYSATASTATGIAWAASTGRAHVRTPPTIFRVFISTRTPTQLHYDDDYDDNNLKPTHILCAGDEVAEVEEKHFEALDAMTINYFFKQTSIF